MKEIQEALNFINNFKFQSPRIGVVLGTGLGGLIENCTIKLSIPYSDIPYFPISTVESHTGQLIFGEISGKPVVIMQGRFHYYEGYNAKEITFPIRVLKELGINNLLISNASGAINKSYKKGDLVILDDHINLLFENPLRGQNVDQHGPRFTDMSEPYDKDLNELLWKCARNIDCDFHTGVYAAWQGPSLETRAEYRMLKILGADSAKYIFLSVPMLNVCAVPPLAFLKSIDLLEIAVMKYETFFIFTSISSTSPSTKGFMNWLNTSSNGLFDNCGFSDSVRFFNALSAISLKTPSFLSKVN